MPQKLKPDEYVGKKYGMLTITGIFDEHRQPSKTKMLCECECGKTCTALLTVIINGRIVSCGCNVESKINYIDETGNSYHSITVIGRYDSQNGVALWRCLCLECNNEVILSGRELRNCNITSCKNCSRKRGIKERRKVKIGEKFGKLLVIKIYDGNAPGNPYKTYACECTCECGKSTIVKGSRLSNGTTKSCGCLMNSYEMRKNHSALLQKVSIEDWKGFSFDNGNLEFRFSRKYKKWRKLVLERDDYTCAKCGEIFNKISRSIQAHHLDSFADFPDKRTDVDNGIALCTACHMPNYSGSFHNGYGTFHNTREQFEEWMLSG